MRLALLIPLIPLILFIAIQPAIAATIVEVKIKGEINEGSYITLEKAFRIAEERDADAILIVLSTPGGLLSSTNKMVELILASETPVVTYVPPGSFAASAGSIILISGHVAAMAGSTSVGAATPVFTGGASESAEKKTISYVAGYVRGIAEKRGRNVHVIEEMVTEGRTLTAKEALELGVIDLIADSRSELLEKLNGWKIRSDDAEMTLDLSTVEIVKVEKPLKAKVFEVLSNPFIASILFLVGLYSLIFGLTSPGMFAETVGAILLILSLIGMGVMNVNYIAAILLLLGILFLLAELMTPTYGLLGAASVICITLGSIMLFEEPLMPKEFYSTFPSLMTGISLGIAAVMTFIILKIFQLRKARKKVGGEAIIGEKGVIIEFKDGKGIARVHGEIWQIESDQELREGDEVVIVGRDGLKLKVERHG
jgi:membrane-bound serine protease (ClpP class)